MAQAVRALEKVCERGPIFVKLPYNPSQYTGQTHIAWSRRRIDKNDLNVAWEKFKKTHL